MLERCCLELLIWWLFRTPPHGLNSVIQRENPTQFLEAISAVVLKFSKMPLPNSGNRPDPGQRASLETVPLLGISFPTEENELEYEAV